MDLNQVPKLDKLHDILLGKDNVLPLSEVAKKTSKKDIDYFPTGFNMFDNVMTGGVSEGDLIIISGKTGEGKTSLGQMLTYNFNKIAIPCLWFSYEVDVNHLWQKFKNMGCDEELLAYTPLKISSGRISWLKDKIKEGILKYQTKVIFIDHLGFLLPDVESYDKNLNQNYSAYLASMCRQLKKLAIDEEVIIVLMAHVRKTSAELEIEDLANSAGIAQEADFVFMIERIKNKKKFETNNYFTDETIVKMVKNRRTGNNKIIKVVMVDDKFLEITNNYGDTN